MTVTVGNKVLVPEYGGTKLSLDEKVRNYCYSFLVIMPIHTLSAKLLLNYSSNTHHDNVAIPNRALCSHCNFTINSYIG